MKESNLLNKWKYLDCDCLSSLVLHKLRWRYQISAFGCFWSAPDSQWEHSARLCNSSKCHVRPEAKQSKIMWPGLLVALSATSNIFHCVDKDSLETVIRIMQCRHREKCLLVCVCESVCGRLAVGRAWAGWGYGAQRGDARFLCTVL